MSLLAKKLLEAASKSDGFEAWSLAPIAAEYIQELEAQRDEMLEALEMVLGILTVAGIGPETEAMQHLQSVIAKAKGE